MHNCTQFKGMVKRMIYIKWVNMNAWIRMAKYLDLARFRMP
jgi:hypothetical protein